MVTKDIDVKKPEELTEKEAMREVDFYLEQIQRSFDRFDETSERISEMQQKNRLVLDEINARIARL